MVGIDLGIVITYLVLMLIIGTLVGRKETIEDFLVNKRKTRLGLLVFTVVSTNVGAGVLTGIAASSYESGISLGIVAVLATFFGFLMMGLMAPHIKRFGDKFSAHTLGDFFGVRYSKSNRFLVGIVIAFFYMFFTAVQFVAVANILKVWTGLEFQSALIFGALTMILYTAVAGIKSDFYTDIIHFWVMAIVFLFVLLPNALLKIGGIASLRTLPESYFSTTTFGGTTFLIGGVILMAFSYLVAMEVWQRIYAAGGEKEAKKAMIWSGIINIPFLTLPIILGMAAKVAIPEVANRDFALFELIKISLPVGLLGLGLAGVLAALLSTANSTIMVSSATLIKDFYKSFLNKTVGDKELLTKGRIITVLVGLISLGLSYVNPNIISLVLDGFSGILVIAPALFGGFFWKRATAKASLVSIIIGLVTLALLLPSMPKTAFVPAAVVSVAIFVAGSFFTKHSDSETTLA